jgi:hypothetical protein
MDDKLDAAAVTTQPTSPMNAARRMSATGTDGAHPLSMQDNAASNQLEQMGYQQEMKRSLGMLSTLGLAFAIMAGAYSSRCIRAVEGNGRRCGCVGWRWKEDGGQHTDPAVPFGTSTTLNIALTDGGPVTILYGVSVIKHDVAASYRRKLPVADVQWIFVSLVSLCMAASLAEM